MTLIEHAPILLIAIPLLAAFLTPIVGRVNSLLRNFEMIIALVSTEFLAILLSYDVIRNGIRTYTLGAKIPGLTSPAGFPVRIILEVDAMNAFISLIASSITLIIAIYCLNFMKEQRILDKFYTLLLLLLTGMLGLTLTGDFFNLFVFLEILSVSSAALIAFYVQRGEALEAAFKYMVISSVGALMVLFAIGLLYGQYDLLNMAAIADSIQGSFLDKVALTLLISAFLLKAGSVPVHMWKPDAYGEAPAPVSVLLLTSALISLYVLFRIFTIFAINPVLLGWILAILGILSIFLGVSMALIQNNLQRLIAYSGIAEIGYIILGVGSGLVEFPSPTGFGFTAISGGLFHILNDTLDLGLLFLIAGAIFYLTGKRDLNIGGLAHSQPTLAVFFLIGMGAVSGLPPFNGFASKLMIYESVYYLNPLLAIIGILGSILMLAIFVKVFSAIFLGIPYDRELRKIPGSMLAVMGILALSIIFIGLFPNLVLESIITPATKALINPKNYIEAIL